MLQKNYLVGAVLAATLFLSSQIFARRGEEPAAAKSSLAVVAIPAYVDTTGSQNYGYLSGSLTDAVDASMQQKFDYARAKTSLNVPDDFTVEAMAAVGRPGPKDDLPPQHLTRELPSQRKPVTELVFAGPYRADVVSGFPGSRT